MEKIKSKYYADLKRVYITEKVQNAHPHYEEWMQHKYRHTMKVVRMGYDIIGSESSVSRVPKETHEQFINACLLHDIARAWQISPENGHHVLKNHGLVGAKECVKLGEESPNVVIPVLVHDQFDGAIILGPESDLDSHYVFSGLNDGDKKFVMNVRSRYEALSDAEKNTVQMGINLVKDADMMANLLEYYNDLCADDFPLVPDVNPYVEETFLSGRLVKYPDNMSYADMSCAFISWGNKIHYPASAAILLKHDIFSRISNHVIGKYRNSGIAGLANLERILNGGVAAVNRNLQAKL